MSWMETSFLVCLSVFVCLRITRLRRGRGQQWTFGTAAPFVCPENLAALRALLFLPWLRVRSLSFSRAASNNAAWLWTEWKKERALGLVQPSEKKALSGLRRQASDIRHQMQNERHARRAEEKGVPTYMM
ncbi:hypothetical protein F5883DRAFT_231661 [Diaporthe sp. PMI_573]|nr:hypothetical protein F5883DRAFT_231661 [Diaporthaceae sp. PMI_573]